MKARKPVKVSSLNPIKNGKYFLDFLARGNILFTDFAIASITNLKVHVS